MLSNRFHSIVAAGITFGLATAAHAAVAINFDGSTGLDQFTIPGTTPFFYTTTAPTVGDTAVKPGTANGSALDGRATYKNATYGLAIDQSITTTIKIAKTSPTGTGTPIVQLGFGTVENNTFDNATAGYSIYARALATATTGGVNNTGGTYRLVYDNKSATGNVASETTAVNSFTIDNPNGNPFYLFSLTLTRTGTSTFTTAGSLQLLAADKTTPLSTVASYAPATITNAGMASAADAGLLYAGFRGTQSAGTLRMDDYTISDVTSVPEPVALGSLAGLAAMLMRRRRRS